jgi:hypothetical protein
VRTKEHRSQQRVGVVPPAAGLTQLKHRPVLILQLDKWRWTVRDICVPSAASALVHIKGLDHARCQTVEYGVFVHPLVLSSGARHGPRIARPHGVTVLKLELSASTTTQAPAAMGAEGLITQEELPAEPDSGSEGSSTPLCPPWRPAGARPRSSLSPR